MAKARSVGVLQFIAAVVTVPVAVLSSIVANGNYSVAITGPLVVMALIQVAAALSLREPDSKATWSPAYLILPLASLAIFVLGSITQLGGAFAGERPTLVVVMSWALATLTIAAATILALSMTLKSARTGLVVLSTVVAALAFSMWTYSAVFKYQEYTNADGDYRPSQLLQACQARLEFLQTLVLKELTGQGESGSTGAGPLYKELKVQADEQALRCSTIADEEQKAVANLVAHSVTSSGSRLPLMYVAMTTALVDFAGALLLLHFGGNPISTYRPLGQRKSAGPNSASAQPEGAPPTSDPESASLTGEQSDISTSSTSKAD